MTKKEFMNKVTNSQADLIQLVLDMLEESHTEYCVIGGLAVNAYAEPVVSLDLDIVVSKENIEKICLAAEARGLKVERFEHSVNLSSSQSDLRIQLQTDARYQEFISHAKQMEVLGYRMNVGSVEDVLQGKIWAYSDLNRRKSKRQKDLADIMRLIEVYPALEERLPLSIRKDLKLGKGK